MNDDERERDDGFVVDERAITSVITRATCCYAYDDAMFAARYVNIYWLRLFTPCLRHATR